MTDNPSSRAAPTGGAIQSLRILAGSLIFALVVIGVALYFVFSAEPDGMDYPPNWLSFALGGLAVLVFLACEAIGYRVQASPTGNGQRRGAVNAYQQGMFLRFALCESVAIISVALAFVVEPGGFMTYLVGGVLSLVLMAIHVWPNDRTIAKTQARLDAVGVEANLRDELFGTRPGGHGSQRGAIQEL